MSLQLKPDYFKTTKILFSNDAVRNTITVFCELVDENATYFLYNSKLIKELLNLGPKCSDMEFLAVLFDFADILKETIQPCFPIFALRKLISIAFFINQLIKQENEENKENSENGHKEKVENTKYLGEIYYLLEISTQLFSSTNQKILSAVVSTYSLVFNMLSSRCRDMAFSDDIENFYKIAKYALKIGQAENILNSAANQQFYLFFLNSIYCFPPDNLINDDVHHLFVDIIKAISYSRQASPMDYNYFSLCDYLITFLKPYKNVYPKETKIFVFSFLSILAMRHEPLVHFLFDDQNIKFFVSFIKETLQQLKPISQHEQILDFFNLPKSEIPPNQIIKTHAFETKFTADNIPIPNLNTESDFTFIPRTPKNIDIKKLIRYIIRLCQIIPDKFYELTSKFMLEFFNSGELSLPMHRFLMFWFNSFIKDDPNKAIESLKPTNLHLFFDLVVFHDLYIRDISQSNFNSIYHIMNNISKADDFKINKNLAEILSEILKRFESDCNSSILDIELVQQYLNIFILAEKIDKNILNSVNFDIILSNILLNQRNAYISSENEEYSKLILNSRIVLFNSLKLFIEIDFFKIYLLSSTTFINTLCQLMFELNIIDFIMQFFGIIIDSYDSTNDQLHSIIVFFQLIFDKVEEPGYIEMAHKLLDYIVLHFHKNSAEIISVFLDTKFLRTLVNFVLSTKNKDDLFNLFRIFQDCSSLQENVKEYLMDLNPFLHLAPLIELQIMDNELKDRLWSIACGQECAFLDKIRTIKDASPLSLIFKAMKVNNESLFSFIHFLRKCCEIDLPSALEICSSDFPSYLIELIQDYRKKEEADDILKETFNLLSLLSKNSMKTKDLLCLFQTLTLISGTKRPFFTLDLIKLMQQIFDTKREIPTSFISSSGKSALLKINETTINQPFSDFTIFFEMKFSSLPHNGKVELLRLVTDKDTTFLLWFNKNQLVLTYLNAELSFESNLEGAFECNEWYQIAFVCKSNTFNVFIDSKLVQNVTIPTIIFSNKIAYGYIGRRLQCCLHSFMFLNTALEQRQFQLLYNLPKSSTSFDISEINEFPHLFQSLFKGIISDSAIFIYNALVTQGKTMPNIAVKYPNCPAEFFGQSYVFSSQPKQIIHCIGGVATLYPLFAQLDQPFLPEMLPSLIDLITALLHNCALNQEEFYFSYGLQVISCLIFSSKLDNITVEFLASLSKLYKEIDYRPLLRQMFLILFLDVRLWIYLPPEKQHKIYQTFINLFEESSNDTQKIIVLKLSFRYILNLIRVCYWTRNLGPQTCLLDKPKIDHNSNEIEAVRPENLELVRKDLFKLAELISAVKFTAQDCETLIFYSFDARDTELCVETQALLLKFLIARNTTLINHLNSNFTFDTFFPLITISEERIRINCLHIFMQFCYPDLRHLLQQYTSHQWISGIVQYFNTKNTSTYLADIALTYTFGYFSSFPNEVNKKYVKFSMGETLPDPQIFSSKFFSLLLMAISEMPLKLSKMYVNEINKAIILKRTDLSKNLYWDHPFLLYIVSRAENEFPDDSVKIVLHFLAFTYIEATRRKQLRETDNARCLLHFLSALLNRDVYYLYEQILLAILEHSLLKGKSRESVVLIFAEAIFEYIFIIPDIDTYATFTFNDHQEIDSDNSNENNDQRLNKCSENTMKRIYKTESYKNIHSLKMKCDKSPLNYIYSSRIDPTSGAWIDKKIAVQFCKLFDLYPVLCENDNFIFMLSFTLSNGILNHYFLHLVLILN
ncbi:hypothetical protein TRFO_24367 [Tritrichomonas foetus]|uniref:DUF4704 domain-containing protein n=1 Tax=Tritrichomonas foetus TaxID=1144522 RepID=A0A1J4K949_9EUKA|nr:hypothetical protein TRFO_24367 [Tritrichomonas foetus]|eukprot:OHT07416.1 hypothetical protein TRFO_24367 [Tritrichomonas foetus]